MLPVPMPAPGERSVRWWQRKRVLVPLGAIVSLALLAGIVWWTWLPRYRPDLRPGETYGVDVSNHQGEIDWAAVAGDDIEFAYIKATEGGDFVDPWFERNWEGAQSAGLDVGAYHYFTLCRSGSKQAENFLATVPVHEADLPAALDLEFAGNCSQRPTRQWVHEEVAQFMQMVAQATGSDVLLYVGSEFDETYGITDTFGEPLWQRRILRRPNGDRWVVWQLSFFSDVDGIDGGVDLDVRRGSPPTP
jgi:lysozyme